MSHEVWIRRGLRLAFSLLVPWALWQMLGPHGLLFAAPLIGALWAGPLISGGSALFRWMNRQAVADLEGCHYAWRGRSLRITTDARGQAWMASGQVRALGIALPPDHLLQARLPPDAWLPADAHRPGLRLRADALADSLVHSSSTTSVRFGRWLQSDVVAPARRQRRST
jgi:hypothetical protein